MNVLLKINGVFVSNNNNTNVCVCVCVYMHADVHTGMYTHMISVQDRANYIPLNKQSCDSCVFHHEAYFILYNNTSGELH